MGSVVWEFHGRLFYKSLHKGRYRIESRELKRACYSANRRIFSSDII